jgi:hypothetical protein
VATAAATARVASSAAATAAPTTSVTAATTTTTAGTRAHRSMASIGFMGAAVGVKRAGLAIVVIMAAVPSVPARDYNAANVIGAVRVGPFVVAAAEANVGGASAGAHG